MNKKKIEIDKFSNQKSICFDYVCDRNPLLYPYELFYDSIIMGADNENFSKLAITPIYTNGKAFLKVRFQDNFFKPKKGDTLSFLFEDNCVLSFVLMEHPQETSRNENWGLIKETLFPLNETDIEVFSSKDFISWKYKSKIKELLFKEGIATNADAFRPIEKLQQNIRLIFEDFNTTLVEELSVQMTLEETEFDTISICYVYLMKDKSNNSYKIGISNNPTYRERTLQSEKPSIELLTSKSFHKRFFAEVFEKVLHESYRNKRIRGEWFLLSEEDINDIKFILR